MAHATEQPTAATDVLIDTASTRGYRRSAALQQRFDAAVDQLRRTDSWTDLHGEAVLAADLVLEGGGVKGIGLVGAVLVLDEAGYTFPRVAGTSAGAIAATLIASIGRAGRPMTALNGYVRSLDFAKFKQLSPVANWIQRLGGIGEKVVDAGELMRHMGIYPGNYLGEWLRPLLDDLGVRTFSDLAITLEDDPGMSLPPERRFRLVIHASDITRGELVRIPWDFDYYGLERDTEDVVRGVRASMSIPFFFEPVTVEATTCDITVPGPGDTSVVEHFEGGSVTWVDGGMLANFPIDAFDRLDGQPPRWPTIGIKLSARSLEMPTTVATHSTTQEAVRCLQTMMNEWDRYHVEQSTAARTIFIDNMGISATQFELTAEQQDALFLSGVGAATDFLIQTAGSGGVPRS
jgi:NTE family protein